MKAFYSALWMLLAVVAPAFGQIPGNAISTANLNTYDTWHWRHDRGTPGYSSASSSYPVTNPSLDGLSRSFSISYSGHGGEIYYVTFGYDTTATSFVYDTYIYLEDPSQVKNVELDLNQVLDDGKTVILGTQCSGYSGTWEYVVEYGGAHWRPSNVACDPSSWAANKWHHIQIAMHRNSSGTVTHDWVSFDGTSHSFNNAVGPAGHNLGWQVGHLILNLQLDGSRKDSGTIKAYVDKLNVYRWSGSGGVPPPPGGPPPPTPSDGGSGDHQN